MNGRSYQPAQDEKDHRGVDKESPPRQRKDVKRDVEVELGIGLAERGAVDPGQHGAPLRHGRGSEEEADQGTETNEQDASKGVKCQAIAIKALLLERDGPKDRPEAVREVGAQDNGGKRQQEEHQEQGKPDPQLGGVDGREIDALVPQPVGVVTGEERERQEQHDQNRSRQNDRSTSPWGWPLASGRRRRCGRWWWRVETHVLTLTGSTRWARRPEVVRRLPP